MTYCNGALVTILWWFFFITKDFSNKKWIFCDKIVCCKKSFLLQCGSYILLKFPYCFLFWMITPLNLDIWDSALPWYPILFCLQFLLVSPYKINIFWAIKVQRPPSDQGQVNIFLAWRYENQHELQQEMVVEKDGRLSLLSFPKSWRDPHTWGSTYLGSQVLLHLW